MANKKLEGIVWPNLPNDVYLLDADKVNYDSEETYSSGSVGKALNDMSADLDNNYAKIDGRYENLTAGNALQLESTVRENDQTPYVFRTSGGSVDIGDREYINGIVGGTVAWNQLAPIPNSSKTKTESGITLTDNRDGSYSISGTAEVDIYDKFFVVESKSWTKNHKYILLGCPSSGSNSTYRLALRGVGGDTVDAGQGAIWNPGTATWKGVAVYVAAGVEITTPVVFKPQLFDITQMFGSVIADYIYSLEQANAGAGVAWFKKLFPKPYYAYNAGELKSVSGLVSHDMTGFNQWDEEWELGYYNTSTGQKTASGSNIRCKNKIRVVPNTPYYFRWQNVSGVVINVQFYKADGTFIRNDYLTTSYTLTTPNDCWYMTFYFSSDYGTTYKHDICINLHWDGSRDGEYEPYELHSYPLDTDLILRGIPKLDANNNLYYDGDEYKAGGSVTRKYISHTFDGTESLLKINTGTTGWYEYAYTPTPATVSGTEINFITDYGDAIASFDTNNITKVVVRHYGLGFRWSMNVDTVEAAKQALIGKTIVYKLETPTTETADPYTSPQVVNDFGTEEYVLSDSIFPIPVGHETLYPVDLKAKVEMAPNSPDGDGDYVVKQTNGTNEYVSLGSTATIQDILERLEALEGQNG